MDNIKEIISELLNSYQQCRKIVNMLKEYNIVIALYDDEIMLDGMVYYPPESGYGARPLSKDDFYFRDEIPIGMKAYEITINNIEAIK